MSSNRVAIVSAVRTPMTKAGTSLKDMHVTDLACDTIKEALYRGNTPVEDVDEVILGNVIMPPDAANPARVSALKAGLPEEIPAYTVQRNCASGMEAVIQGYNKIKSGEADVVLTGGAESMSNAPLLFKHSANKIFTKLAKSKTFAQKLKVLMKLKVKHFMPESSLMSGLTDPTINLIMGKTAEIIAKEFDISKELQDEFSVKSHESAIKAINNEIFDERITTIYEKKNNHPVSNDVGPRAGQNMNALAKLKPIFDKKDGSVTVGNSCQITDGAAILLLMSEKRAKKLGLKVLGYIDSHAVAGCSPSRMGLGPVFATEKLFRNTKFNFDDIDLVEINEAFAAQVLACIKLFVKKGMLNLLSLDKFEKKLNVNGGAIALGHPVGMTGSRLIMDIAYELQRRNLKRGLATLCIGGGQGEAVIVEKD